MANIIQKVIYYFARQAMYERTSREAKGLFFDRVIEDHLARYNFASSFVTNKTVLDIASGEGYGTAMVAKKAIAVTGVDVSAKAIGAAQQKYSSQDYPNIQFIFSDAIKYFSHNKLKFDVIVSYETIEHITDYELFLELVKKHLKPNGLLILSTPNKIFSDIFAGDTFNPYHVKEFYSQELSDIITRIFGQKPDIYCQRPVEINHLIWSYFKVFVFRKESPIKKATANFTGIDMIYLARNKS
jgi:2-polyprenyl-3-methyl-5-hydroxy-6-metoxy-1,4-benzoquinol methylase